MVAVVRDGRVVDVPTVVLKDPRTAAIVLAPLIGFILALLLAIVVMNLLKRKAASKVDRWFRGAQLLSAGQHASAFVTPDTKYIVAATRFSRRMGPISFQLQQELAELSGENGAPVRRSAGAASSSSMEAQRKPS